MLKLLDFRFIHNPKLGQAYKRIAIGILIAYLFSVFYIIHIKCVGRIHPNYRLGDLMSEGFADMFRHPFAIFPLPYGTGRTIFWFTIVAAVALGLIFLVDAVRAHDDPDTVQGDAQWLTKLNDYNKRFTEPFGSIKNDGKNNMILSKDIFLSLDNQKTRRNQNIFVIGGSGSGKSYNLVGPNIMQANCSYVITDPSGGLFAEYGSFLEYYGYTVKCFNLSHMEKGSHYNPFNYIHSDKDIQILVNTLITNTTPKDKSGGDPFWEKAETALLGALIAYLFHYTTKENQNFSNVMRLMHAAEINENDSSSKSSLDYIFDEIEAVDPESFAVKQYKDFKMGAGKTLMGILVSCAVRLQKFELEDVEILTNYDDIDLDSIGDEKTALFIIIPTQDRTFNFIAAMMYTQLFERCYSYCEDTAHFTQLIMDAEDQVVKSFRAISEKDSEMKREEAEAFLERARNGHIVYSKKYEWYEIRTSAGEFVTHRGDEELAQKAFQLISEGRVIRNTEQTNANGGRRLPIATRLLLDEFANIGKLGDSFDNIVATCRKYCLSVTIILQSLQQMKKLYKDDWSSIAGNCDNTIYLGGGADAETTKWVSELLGKQTRVVMNATFGKQSSTSLNRQGVELYTPAQLRTMPEDECIVIPKSLFAFKGKKYMTNEHPERSRVESLPVYYFDEEKAKYIQQMVHGKEEEQVRPTAEEVHGDAEAPAQEEVDEKKAEADEKKQRAKEYAENKDAEGKPIINDPVEINDPKSNFEEKIAIEDEDVQRQIEEGFNDGYTNESSWSIPAHKTQTKDPAAEQAQTEAEQTREPADTDAALDETAPLKLNERVIDDMVELNNSYNEYEGLMWSSAPSEAEGEPTANAS